MKGNRCIWGCGNAGHNYVCVPAANPTQAHVRTVEMCAEAQMLLREARSLIDTLKGNIQGQTSAEVRDPVAYAACQDMIARIDALVR